MKQASVTAIHSAGPNHRVLTIEGGSNAHCKRPCAQCPWRKDAVGIFPPDAFRHSAVTAYDMAPNTFGCHSRPTASPATCAGFLLVGAEHNLRVRMQRSRGAWLDVTADGHDLFTSYREMAIANGVDPEDPALARCRSADE